MCFQRDFNINLSNEGTGHVAFFFPRVLTKKWKVLALIRKPSKFNANVHIFLNNHEPRFPFVIFGLLVFRI